VKSYTVSLSTIQPFNGLPSVDDHYLFLDPLSGSNFVYPTSADGTDFSYSTGQPTATADDGAFSPWGYTIQDLIQNIPVGPLKGPYTINFDPSQLDTTSIAINKIVYNFGDGSPETIITAPAVQGSTIVNGQLLSATNPNNIIVSHNYYPQSNSSITVFTPSITAYGSNIIRNIFNVVISAAPISIYEFDDIHLINNTQQLSAIETQNVFEIDNPDYLTVARVISAVDPNYPTVIPFDPNTSVLYNDLITWLDAADSATISKDANNSVWVWYDKSIYQNNFFNDSNNPSFSTNPTANSPTFLYPRQSRSGRKCVSFKSNPNNQYLYALAVPGTGFADNVLKKYGQGFTVFAVMRLNQIGSQDTLFAYDLNTNEVARNNDPNQLAQGNGQNYLPFMNVSFSNNNSMTVEQGDTSYYFGTSSYDTNNGIYQPTNTGTISQNLTSYSLFSFTVSGNKNANAYFTADTAIIQRNNQNYQNSINTLSAFLAGGYNSATGQYISAGNYDYNLVYGLLGTSDAYYNSYLTDAEISEFMVFDRPLDPVSIASVQTYLVNKWGLTLQTN